MAIPHVVRSVGPVHLSIVLQCPTCVDDQAAGVDVDDLSRGRHAHVNINAAARFLDWLREREITLDQARQGDVDKWLTGGHARYQVRDFLGWAARTGHARPPAPGPHPGIQPRT